MGRAPSGRAKIDLSIQANAGREMESHCELEIGLERATDKISLTLSSLDGRQFAGGEDGIGPGRAPAISDLRPYGTLENCQ